MAYTKQGMSNNIGAINSASFQDSIPWRFYRSRVDTLTEVLTPGYFNAAIQNLDYDLQVGDVLLVQGSDKDTELAQITSIDPDVTLISVIGTPSIQDGSITTAKIADSAVTTIKLASGAVTEDKVAADAISGSKTKDYILGTNEPYVPIAQVIPIAAGPGGNTDKTFANTGMVIDYAVIKFISAGTTGDSVQLFDASGNAITEAFDTNVAAKKVRFFDEIDTLYNEVATGSFIRATVVDGGGADTPELEITLYGYAKV